MSKWKNYSLYVSIAAFIPMFLKAIGHDVLPTNYNELVTSFLSILVVAGIISNPSIGTGYTDTVKPTTPTDITNEVK